MRALNVALNRARELWVGASESQRQAPSDDDDVVLDELEEGNGPASLGSNASKTGTFTSEYIISSRQPQQVIYLQGLVFSPNIGWAREH